MTTLLAVTGLSPAIVTETLWALAHEKPAILPRRVLFLTTATGAEEIEKQLFTPLPEWKERTVWECLRLCLKAAPDELIAEPALVIPMSDGSSGRALPLDDIRTPAENAAAAEFIFSQVWSIVRDPERRLIASIAGGRKTMGALLHSAVSLIGRENDRVTHVLVDPPYETLSGFYFPGQPGSPLASRTTAASYDPSAARLHLADVPFVPLRNRFQELDELPPSFLTLREQLSEKLKLDAARPARIRIRHPLHQLEIDGMEFTVRARALAVLHFILKCNEKESIPPDQTTAADAFNKRVTKDPSAFGQPGVSRLDAADFRRELNYLRDLLKRASWQPASRTLRQPPFLLES
jgi:CRISPR-associated protein (TIGR02584 family)